MGASDSYLRHYRRRNATWRQCAGHQALVPGIYGANSWRFNWGRLQDYMRPEPGHAIVILKIATITVTQGKDVVKIQKCLITVNSKDKDLG